MKTIVTLWCEMFRVLTDLADNTPFERIAYWLCETLTPSDY